MSDQDELWPSERGAGRSDVASNAGEGGALTTELIAAVAADPEFMVAAHRLGNAVETNTPAKTIIADFETEQTEGQHTPDPVGGGWRLAVAALSYFRKKPTAETWRALWRLGYHSVAFEQTFAELVTFIAKNDETLRECILRVAGDVVAEARRSPGRGVNARERERYIAMLDAWKAEPNLQDIWWGLRGSDHFLDVGDDDGMLAIVADLDMASFMGHVAAFDQPYSVQHALLAAGASRSMSRWRQMLCAAPGAFEPDGSWNGSAVVPLLLVIARDQLRDGYHDAQRRAAIGGTASNADTDRLAKAITEALARRPDAGPTARRWSAWLFRQVLTRLSEEETARAPDAGTRAYPEAQLIGSLAAAVPPEIWQLPEPGDCELWEPWCDRGARVTAALSGRAEMPEASSFLSEWGLTIDDVYGRRGAMLAERASMFLTFGRRSDAYGTLLLALPLMETDDPGAAWSRFWKDCDGIRERIEFDDYAAAEETAERLNPSAARELMQLAFGIGLAVLDQLALVPGGEHGKKTAGVEAQFAALLAAMREMTAIDKFSTAFWSSALQHLVIRRAIWGDADPAQSGNRAFSNDFKPGLAELLGDAAGDHELICILIDVLLRNKVPLPVVAAAVRSAKIDLGSYLVHLERLITIGDRRLAISKDHITSVKAVRDAVSGT